jgi:fermentation-respiration switch protein FrsA (DUF1100 family)
MVIVDKKTIAGIPLLEIVRKELILEATPTIFFLHGFTSFKERNLHYAYLLAEKNIRVVLPEADLHGERSKSLSVESLALHFWNIILQNIKELDDLKRDYVDNNLVLENQIGVAGTSMGAITALGALTQYDWIKTVVSLMGNPSYDQYARYLVVEVQKQGLILPFSEEQLEEEYKKVMPFDLSKNQEQLNNRPVLFWHGMKDTVVPYTHAYQFYQDAKDYYANNSDDFQFILDERADHKVTQEGMKAMIEWFGKHLTSFSNHPRLL